MADKYCDHGAYGAAVVVGNTTSGSATLTVTSVTSGALGLGAHVTGVGIPDDTIIKALGTGLGGNGTYTLSRNASSSQTGTTVTAKYCGPLNIPLSWGVPQEGDGTTKDAATASATIAITLSAYTAAAGNTISIGGATLTCVASGATNNQFNAGTGTTLIDNIVAAINRAGNTVTVSAAASGWATPKVQDAFFARRTGNDLEIMTRAGSAAYNSNASFKVLTSGFTGGAQIDQQFTGGSGGCWGWLANYSLNIWPSAITVASTGYGVWGGTQPLAGVQSAGDVVYLRSGKRITTTNVDGVALSPAASIGAYDNPVRHIVDDHTVWTTDSESDNLHIRYEGYNGTFIELINPGGLYIAGRKRSDSDYSLVFELISGSTVSITILNNNELSGFKMIGNTSVGFRYGGASNRRPALRNFNITKSTNSAFLSLGTSSSNTAGIIENVVLDNSGAAVACSQVLGVASSQPSSEFIISNLKCLNFVVGSSLFGSGIPTSTYPKYSFINPSFGNVTSRSGILERDYVDTWSGYISQFTSYGSRDFLVENLRGLTEWNSSTSQPVLNALLPDGSTKWSWRIQPLTTAGRVNPSVPLTTPNIKVINSLTSGARTLTLEFCASDATTWTKKDVFMTVAYRDSSGENVVLSSLDYAGGALTASTATWNQESGGKVTFSSGGTLYHNKYKLQVSTPTGHDLPEGAEITVTFNVTKAVSNTTQMLFVDPDLSIA